MSELKNNQLPYYPIKLWIDSTITIIILISSILIFAMHDNQPFGLILGLTVWGIGGKHLSKTIKNLYRNINNKPAIELTEDYFFDHINNIKIYWNNIRAINMISVRGNTYVNFDLRDKKSYYKQLDGAIQKILFKLPDPDEISVKTEISLIKGKNEEIYQRIYKFHQSKKNNCN
jgi:hypothetical protein